MSGACLVDTYTMRRALSIGSLHLRLHARSVAPLWQARESLPRGRLKAEGFANLYVIFKCTGALWAGLCVVVCASIPLQLVAVIVHS